MQLVHVEMDNRLPLHRWSSRRNNSHPLVMSSLNYVTLLVLAERNVSEA